MPYNFGNADLLRLEDAMRRGECFIEKLSPEEALKYLDEKAKGAGKPADVVEDNHDNNRNQIVAPTPPTPPRPMQTFTSTFQVEPAHHHSIPPALFPPSAHGAFIPDLQYNPHHSSQQQHDTQDHLRLTHSTMFPVQHPFSSQPSQPAILSTTPPSTVEASSSGERAATSGKKRVNKDASSNTTKAKRKSPWNAGLTMVQKRDIEKKAASSGVTPKEYLALHPVSKKTSPLPSN